MQKIIQRKLNKAYSVYFIYLMVVVYSNAGIPRDISMNIYYMHIIYKVYEYIQTRRVGGGDVCIVVKF